LLALTAGVVSLAIPLIFVVLAMKEALSSKPYLPGLPALPNAVPKHRLLDDALRDLQDTRVDLYKGTKNEQKQALTQLKESCEASLPKLQAAKDALQQKHNTGEGAPDSPTRLQIDDLLRESGIEIERAVLDLTAIQRKLQAEDSRLASAGAQDTGPTLTYAPDLLALRKQCHKAFYNLYKVVELGHPLLSDIPPPSLL